MVKLILFLLALLALAFGLSWLADRPGELVINWQGYELQTSVFRAVVILAGSLAVLLFVLSLARQLWQSPAALGDIINRRRNKRGLEALSAGMIAIGAGDRATATRYAIQARKTLPNEPLTHLLRAQAAQLSGDKTTARRIFEAMLGSPDTEQLGLRGLFLEAEREGETEAAIQFAERAMKLNPKLSWSVDALFDLQCEQGQWSEALETLSVARRNGHIEKQSGDRRRAVLLTAIAQAAEDSDPETALTNAIEAHNLAPDLVPAAAIAGRLLSSRGNTPRATKIIQRTWSRSPHPDLATAYAFARLGDSPRDRLERVKQLAALCPNSVESPVAIATTAIEARDYDLARRVLEPLHEERLSHRVCLLMARIEGEQTKDKGRVREWLARAVNAPRDPAWTADGIISDRWQPVSPVTGQLDAFQWRVPVEQMEQSDSDLLTRKIDELMALGADPRDTVAADRVIDAKPAAYTPPPATAHPAGPAPAAAQPPVEPRRSEPAASTYSVSSASTASSAAPATPPLVAPPPVAARVAATAVESAQSPAAAANLHHTARCGGAGAHQAESGPVPSTTPTSPPVQGAALAPPPKPATTAQPERAAPPAKEPAKAAIVPPERKERSAVPAAAAVEATPAAPAVAVTVAPPASAKPGPVKPAGEPRMFVPPPVPDDPGPDSGDGVDLPKSPLRTIRAGS